jgi:translation initiation factor 3 subunit B
MAARVMEPIDPLDVAAKLFKDQPKGFPFEGFDIEELILPEGEDFGIRSDDGVDDEEDLEAETGFGSVIGMLRTLLRTTAAATMPAFLQ